MSTGAMVAVFVCLFMAALLSAVAIGIALLAKDRADVAEREARVAQDKMQYYQTLMIEKGVISAGEIHH
jgi:hypothetical protein